MYLTNFYSTHNDYALLNNGNSVSMETKCASVPCVGMLPFSSGKPVNMAIKYNDISLIHSLSSLTKRKHVFKNKRGRQRRNRGMLWQAL
jgi:hypothetical protein